ncbi:ACP S-malonyltransferase [Saccharomonospora azurea]|uniref:ACP S-malonyltransferase n=1 Tax=Saccharomonospora azurea TaxID=40988 RepID=UPI0033209B64
MAGTNPVVDPVHVVSEDGGDASAFFFPGLDAFTLAEIGKFFVLSPHARERLAVADDVLGRSVTRALRDSDDYASPVARVASLVNALALADWARQELGVEPRYCLGMSFGEQIAATYAGCLSLETAVSVIARIGECELEYFRSEHRELVTQVVTRLPAERRDDILADLAARDVFHEVSGRVDEGHYLITLPREHLADFTATVSSAGGYALQTMDPPAHCAVFAPLSERVAKEVLADVEFADPAVPIVSDEDGSVVTTGAGVRDMVASGFVRPLNWLSTAPALAGLGVRRLYVVGLDRMWHRLSVTKSNFDVTPVNQARVLRHRRG